MYCEAGAWPPASTEVQELPAPGAAVAWVAVGGWESIFS